MAERPLPRGDGDGLDAGKVMKFQQNVYGIIGRQQRDLNSLGKGVGDLINELKESSAQDHEWLMDISMTLGRIHEDMIPISNYFKEQLEESPGQPEVVVAPAPGVAGEAGDQAQQADSDTQDKVKGSTGAFGRLAAVLGSAGGGGVAGALVSVGLGLGAVGLGLAAITGALYLGAAAVEKFGDGLVRVSEGIEELNDTQVDPEQFEKLGKALSDLVGGIGMGGAMSLMIIAATDLERLSKGIEVLNNTEFDPANLQRVAMGLETFLSTLSSFGALGGSLIAQMVDDNLIPLSDGVKALAIAGAEVPADFQAKMALAGAGVGDFIDGVGAQFLDAAVVQMIDDNLPMLGEGILKLSRAASNIDDAFPQKMELAGKGINALMVAMGGEGFFGWLGSLGDTAVVSAIDDNLPALAEGITLLANTPVDEGFVTKMTQIGRGFQALFDGTDDLLGVMGAQMTDDNLPIIADGVNILAATNAEEFYAKAQMIGQGFQDMFDGTDDFIGVMGAQMVDDNLPIIADGVNILAQTNAETFAVKAQYMKSGFEDLFNATDDIIGVMGAQMVDDNLPIIANGVNLLADTKAEEFAEKAGFIGTGMGDLLTAFSESTADLEDNIDQMSRMSAIIRDIGSFNVDTGDSISTAIGAISSIPDVLNNERFPGRGEFSNFFNFMDSFEAKIDKFDVDKTRAVADALSGFSSAQLASDIQTSEAAPQRTAMIAELSSQQQPTNVNVVNQNTTNSVQQNNVRGAMGGARATVSPPTAPQRLVYV